MTLPRKVEIPDPAPKHARPVEHYRQRSVVALQRCRNPFCREWLPEGSREAGKCLVCHHPLTEAP